MYLKYYLRYLALMWKLGDHYRLTTRPYQYRALSAEEYEKEVKRIEKLNNGMD